MAAVQDAPTQREGVRLVRHDDVGELVDVDGREICLLNETALALWDLCDGSIVPSEMASAIAELFGIDPEVAMNDVATTLAMLRAAGVIRWKGISPA